MNLKVIASLIGIFLILTLPLTSAVNTLGIFGEQNIEDIESGDLITGAPTGVDNTVVVPSDEDYVRDQSFLQEENFANIMVTVSSYEPTILTSAVLEEGRKIPIFVNLKGYSADPTLDQVRILSMSPRIKDVKTTPDRNIARPTIQTRFNRDTTLDNLGYLVVWLNRLEQEHSPVEETTLFTDLPEDKQKQILNQTDLTDKNETERKNILDEQAKSLVKREKDQDWVLDLPRKAPYLEEVDIDLQLDILFETLSGFGAFEESKVGKIGDKISFWNGQGSIQIKEITDSYVVVDVFSGDARLIRKDAKINIGSSISDDLGRGLQFNDQFILKLDKIRRPGNTATFLVNDKYIELGVGESFPSLPELVVDDINEYPFTTDYGLRKIQLVRIKNTKTGKLYTIERKQLIKGDTTTESQTTPAFKIPSQLESYTLHINVYSIYYSLDPYLVSAVILAESTGGNPKSIGPDVTVNGKTVNAVGLMQLIPDTAREVANKLGLTVKIVNYATPISDDDRFDPNINIQLGAFYLKQQLDEFKETRLALAAYNWGPQKVRDNCKDSNGKLDYNSCKFGSNTATPKYVNDVLNKINSFKVSSVKGVATSAALQNKYQEALNTYDEIIKNYPAAVDESGIKVAAKALHQKAKIYEEKLQNLAEARNIYLELSEKYSDYYKNLLPNKLEEIDLLLKEGENLWDTGSASLFEDGTTIFLRNVKILSSAQTDRAIIAISKDNKAFSIDEAHKNGYVTGEKVTGIWEITRIDESTITLTKQGKSALERDTIRTIKKGSTEKLDGISVILQDTNVNTQGREAKFIITPRANRARSTTEVTLHLPIEQRSIQLSSQQIKDQIKKAEDVVNKLENVISKLDKIVRWWKVACFTIGGALTIKNFFSGSAKAEARQISVDKWSNQCKDERDVTGCIDKNAENIDKDTSNFEEAIKARNDLNKKLNAKEKETKKVFNRLTKDEVKETLTGINFGSYQSDIDTILSKQDLSQAELGRLVVAEKYSEISGNKNYFEDTVASLQIKERAAKWKEVDNRLKKFGIKDPSNKASLMKEFNLKDEQQLDIILTQLYSGVSELDRGVIVKKGDKFYLIGPNEEIEVTQSKDGNTLIYTDKASKKYVNLLEAQDKSIEIKNKKIIKDGFGRVNIAPYIGKSGRYLEVSYRTESTDYTRIDQILITTAGPDGKMLEGNDNYLEATCNSRGTTTCTAAEFEKLSRQIIDLNKNLLNNKKDAKYITYSGIKIAVDEASTRNKNCEDYMDASDCQLLYKTCDWVICPSSRFDFGGKWHVDNVIQSGIVGSIILGLPRNEVCVTGVLAGLKNIQSIYKGYGQCLQTARAEDKSVGLCDKVRSVYVCELVWKSAVPLAAAGVQKIFENKDSEGGGEYSNFNNAFENAENSFNYIINDYAKDSFARFRVSSVDEVGTTICQRAIFGTVPGGADFFDQLTAPANPPQFTAWFDEFVWSKENIKTSRYSVFYQIYSGDGGDLVPFNQDFLQYSVYLKDPVLGVYPVTQSPNIRRINLGESAQETADFIAPSGYSQICVELNGRAYCNFGKVTTGAGLSYVTDLFVSNQATKKISSFEDCTSNYGTGPYQGSSSSTYLFSNRISTSPYSSTAKGGTSQSTSQLGDFSLGLFGNGIIRTCNNGNPNPNAVSSTNPDKPKWVQIGECGIDKKTNTNYGGCWLDVDSVANSLNTEIVRDKTLSQLDNQTLESKELFNEIEGYSGESGYITNLFAMLNEIASIDQINNAKSQEDVAKYIVEVKYFLVNSLGMSGDISTITGAATSIDTTTISSTSLDNVKAEALYRLGLLLERDAAIKVATESTKVAQAGGGPTTIPSSTVSKSFTLIDDGVPILFNGYYIRIKSISGNSVVFEAAKEGEHWYNFILPLDYKDCGSFAINNKKDCQAFNEISIKVDRIYSYSTRNYVDFTVYYTKPTTTTPNIESSTTLAYGSKEFDETLSIGLGGIEVIGPINGISYRIKFTDFNTQTNEAIFTTEKRNSDGSYSSVDCGSGFSSYFTDKLTLKEGEYKKCGDLQSLVVYLKSIDLSLGSPVVDIKFIYDYDTQSLDNKLSSLNSQSVNNYKINLKKDDILLLKNKDVYLKLINIDRKKQEITFEVYKDKLYANNKVDCVSLDGVVSDLKVNNLNELPCADLPLSVKNLNFNSDGSIDILIKYENLLVNNADVEKVPPQGINFGGNSGTYDLEINLGDYATLTISNIDYKLKFDKWDDAANTAYFSLERKDQSGYVSVDCNSALLQSNYVFLEKRFILIERGPSQQCSGMNHLTLSLTSVDKSIPMKAKLKVNVNYSPQNKSPVLNTNYEITAKRGETINIKNTKIYLRLVDIDYGNGIGYFRVYLGGYIPLQDYQLDCISYDFVMSDLKVNNLNELACGSLTNLLIKAMNFPPPKNVFVSGIKTLVNQNYMSITMKYNGKYLTESDLTRI